ncbi:MAG: hypothetical protein ABI772_15285 [Bacteroidota bacterium]
MIILLSSTLFQNAFAQGDMMEKQKLRELLDKRKERFSDYFNSMEKRSGIFGNKTKKDLSASNEILKEVVRTDNQIIQVLNRAMDYKTFEKTGFNYEKLSQDQLIRNLQTANDTLTKTQVQLTKEISGNKNQVRNWRLIAILLFVFIIIRGGINFRRRKSGTANI